MGSLIFTSVDITTAKQSSSPCWLLTTIVGDRNFRGQRNSTYACCTGESHASDGVSHCRQMGGEIRGQNSLIYCSVLNCQ